MSRHGTVFLTLILIAGLFTPATAQPQRQFTFEAFAKRHDADKDGKITRKEFRGPAKLFDQLDADRDGAVTAAEFQAATKRLRQWQKRAKQHPGGPKVSQGVKAIRNVEYAKVDGKSLKLDLYVPQKPKSPHTKPPLLVWIHGGAWRAGSKAGINPCFLRLTAEGYAAASIDYRLNGLQAHPEHIHDCKGAIRWLRANAEKYGYDATRIGVGGGSAGGHLVLLLGTSAGVKELEGDVGGNLDRSSRVQAVVDLFGPADFERWAGQSARFRADKSAKLLKSASPVTYLTKDDAAILIFHGDKDPLVPLTQSQSIHKRYQKAGLESALHVIPGAGHGGRQFTDDARYALVKAFLDRHIKQVGK